MRVCACGGVCVCVCVCVCVSVCLSVCVMCLCLCERRVKTDVLHMWDTPLTFTAISLPNPFDHQIGEFSLKIDTAPDNGGGGTKPKATRTSYHPLSHHLALSSASPRGQWRTGKMEKTGCKIICGAPTTLAVKG